MDTLIPCQFRPARSIPIKKTLMSLSIRPRNLQLHGKAKHDQTRFALRAAKIQQPNLSDTHKNPPAKNDDDGILADDVKMLAKFKSRHNYIRVLEVSRRADHPLAGSRLLLLDNPGNIHSISFLFKCLTSTYFDIFATLPPILPPGPIAILGFGAGSAARLILHLYPETEIHGYELDPSVIAVAREFFSLTKLEKQNQDRLFIYVDDALNADYKGGFAAILVDLFSKGSVIPELQDSRTWKELRKRLRKGGRMMVNCGGSCVESEDPKRDGESVKEETLRAMSRVFADQVFVLNLDHRKEDSSVALTGPLPDLEAWKEALPASLRCYVDMWTPYR
uniref:Uncharacterized protein LOC105058784 n=1 Tax=Elaeis guineensis var. tenera TaxID=51953 RepID=A0A6I9SAW9_ELAGV|nr:uncharacterized protein LOC105058784 [Elaeis guineensis]